MSCSYVQVRTKFENFVEQKEARQNLNSKTLLTFSYLGNVFYASKPKVMYQSLVQNN